ncbi:MAG: quinol:electron acceptor oxidoreductase subunit ActD [Syntrophothermus sp.]
MQSNTLFAVAAQFNEPNKLIKAVKIIADLGYKKWDVNTPYPVHGMDAAMKLKSSKLGYVTLFFGLSGTALALLLMWWTMSVDYPMIIGGKPFFALPAFIPVTFELTVLLATLATVIGMLSVFFNLPNNSHPLHDTNYMQRVSADHFGIYVEADDKKFNAEELRTLFLSLDAVQVDDIYVPLKEKYPILQPKFLVFLTIVFAVTSAITYFTLNYLLYMEPFDWMVSQAKVTPQEKVETFRDGFGMRQPVKGTVARGFLPYKFMGMPAPAESLVNPIIPTKETVELGKRKFLAFCSPCHGNFADGDSRLRGQFQNPPTLHSTRVREMNDGMIYHIITNGQNAMPSYAPQITREERWSIVNYIRVLQRAKNAEVTDVQKVKKEPVKNGQ